MEKNIDNIEKWSHNISFTTLPYIKRLIWSFSKQFDTIRDMLDFIRTWWLIRKIVKICRFHRAMNYSINHSKRNEIYTQTIAMDKFLRTMAEKSWYCFFYSKSEKRISLKMEYDSDLLYKARDKDYIQFGKDPNNGLVIHYLPEGAFFSDWTNGLTDFLDRYHKTYLIILGIIWYPVLKPLMQTVWNIIF